MKKIAIVLAALLALGTVCFADATTPLSSTTGKLSKDSVKEIALNQMREYLSSDSQTKGKSITLSDEFTNLYDIDEVNSGYVIPLQSKGHEIGNVTVSTVDGHCVVQAICIDDNANQKFNDKVNEAKKKHNIASDSTKLIYIPPMSYVIESSGSNGSKEYTSLDGTSVSDSIEKDKQKIRKFRDEINSNIMQSNNLTNNISALASVSVEDVRLSREAVGSFVPVTGSPDGGTAYGGSQMWWPSSSGKQGNGCGPVAAANITQYLASKNSTKYGKLYPYSSASYSNFMNQMNTMYSLINPGIIGEPLVSDFKTKVLRYAQSKGVSLTGTTFSSGSARDNYATFVKAGLNNDTPVGCLNLQPTGYTYGAHWMTITKYYRDSTDKRWVGVSTWGQRYSVNFDTWQSSTWNWGGGMIYFY